MIYALASFVSPLIGSYMYNDMEFGLRKTFDVAAFINIIFAINIFFNNCGLDVMVEDRNFVAKLDTLKSRSEDKEGDLSEKDNFKPIEL